jgi:hypothetical protein
MLLSQFQAENALAWLMLQLLRQPKKSIPVIRDLALPIKFARTQQNHSHVSQFNAQTLMAIHVGQEERAKIHQLGSPANLSSAVISAQFHVVRIRRACKASVSVTRDSPAPSHTLAVWQTDRLSEPRTDTEPFRDLVISVPGGSKPIQALHKLFLDNINLKAQVSNRTARPAVTSQLDRSASANRFAHRTLKRSWEHLRRPIQPVSLSKVPVVRLRAGRSALSREFESPHL